MARTSSPRRAKSADRMEGATLMLIGGLRPAPRGEPAPGSVDLGIQRTVLVALGHVGQRNDLDLRSLAGGAELLVAGLAQLLHGGNGRLQISARIEFRLLL